MANSASRRKQLTILGQFLTCHAPYTLHLIRLLAGSIYDRHCSHMHSLKCGNLSCNISLDSMHNHPGWAHTSFRTTSPILRSAAVQSHGGAVLRSSTFHWSDCHCSKTSFGSLAVSSWKKFHEFSSLSQDPRSQWTLDLGKTDKKFLLTEWFLGW